MPRTKVDPNTAAEIENDMAEIDKADQADEVSTEKESVSAAPCPNCIDSKIGPGLLDANTICPDCQGTGKVAVLG